MKTKYQMLPRLTCLLSVLLLWLAPARGQAQTLLLHYNFNGLTTDGAAPDLSGNHNDGVLAGSGAQGADQTGVSGQPGDRAFNNTASIMGSTIANSGGAVIAPALGGVTSFTISLWFKTDGKQPLANARLFDASDALLFAGVGAGKVSFNASGTVLASNATSNALLAAQDSWVFVAVTYDGTSGSGLGNVRIYAGSSTESVVLVATNTAASITGVQDLARIYFGSNGTLGRAFDGWLDDIRVYGDGSGASGALSVEALDAVRLAGLSQIPESSSVALLTGGAALLAISVRAGRRGN